MPATGSPTIPRRELGALLRSYRTRKGLTAEQVGVHLGMSASKVSRLETGQRGASHEDVLRLCELYGLEAKQREHLVELASAGKQRAWWQPLGLPYSNYVGLEAEAASISDYGLGHIPGLLQTPGYAQAILRAAVPPWPEEIVEQRVAGRLARQQVLYSANAPRFDAVLDESVLHRIVGSPQIMQAQLRHLLDMSELPNVTIRMVPYEAGALPSGNNKFIILGFAQPTVPDIVFIEGLTGDLYLHDPAEVDRYNQTYRTLIRLAAGPAATREMITAMVTRYARLPG